MALPSDVRAVLFDRDGTLVVDVPYNGDPQQVRLVPGATAALEGVRAAGLGVGIVSNQSGVGRGMITATDVAAVHARVSELAGPFDVIAWCPHTPEDGCRCRKPAPGLVLSASRTLGIPPSTVVVVGDIGADMDAARRAGAGGILVPTPVTRPEEIAAAEHVAADLGAAVRLVLAARGSEVPA